MAAFLDHAASGIYLVNLYSLGQTPGAIEISSMAMFPRLFLPTIPSKTICKCSKVHFKLIFLVVYDIVSQTHTLLQKEDLASGVLTRSGLP